MKIKQIKFYISSPIYCDKIHVRVERCEGYSTKKFPNAWVCATLTCRNAINSFQGCFCGHLLCIIMSLFHVSSWYFLWKKQLWQNQNIYAQTANFLPTEIRANWILSRYFVMLEHNIDGILYFNECSRRTSSRFSRVINYLKVTHLKIFHR